MLYFYQYKSFNLEPTAVRAYMRVTQCLEETRTIRNEFLEQDPI